MTDHDVRVLPRPGLVHAAGGVLWRPGEAGAREVVLVHRPRYDDWSLPKGKAKPGEHLLVTALREVEEETGYGARLGPFLARYRYTPPRAPRTADGVPVRKDVAYWAMARTQGQFAANDEVDAIAWLPLEAAAGRVTHAIDRKVLDAFAALPPATTPVVVVRGAHSVGRGEPALRPLDARGVAAAQRLVPVLAGAGVGALLCAPVARCVQTVQPYAVQSGLPVEFDADLGLPGTATGPLAGAASRVLDHAAKGVGVAVCVNGPAVGPLLAALAGAAGAVAPVEPALRKGGWWLLHVAAGRLVAQERHAPAVA